MRPTTISWPSIIAGSAISLLAYVILSLLALALGGEQPLTDILIRVAGFVDRGFDTPAAIGFLLIVSLSLLAGAYTAGRLLPRVASVAGLGHGLSVAVIFFLLMPVPMVTGVTPPSRWSIGIGGIANALELPTQGLRPEEYSAVALTLGPRTNQQSAQADTTRIIGLLSQGNSGTARDLLVSEGVPVDEASRRLENAEKAFTSSIRVTRSKLRAVASVVAWSLLMTVLVGGGAAVLGAVLGARTGRIVEELEREEISRAA